MAEDIRIAGGYVEIKSKVDDDGLRRDAKKAGEDYEENFAKAVEKKADGDKGRFRRIFDSIGSSVVGAVKGVMTTVVPMLGAILNGGLAVAPAIAAAAVAVYQFGAAAVTASPALIALRGEFALAYQVIKGFGETMAKEGLKPLIDGISGAEKSAAHLASKGLEPLSKKFIQLNLPAIQDMMNRLAGSTNRVVAGFLNWANTAAGITAIRNITKSTADLIQNLEKPLQGVVISFVQMWSRIADVSTAAGSSGLEFVLNKVNEVLDKITAKTVTDGLQKLKDDFTAISNAVKTTIDWVKTAIDFYKRWKTEINLVSDALGILAIVFGGPVTAIIAAIGLIIRHFDLVKQILSKAKDWFSGVKDGSDIMDRLKQRVQEVWQAIQNAGQVIWDMIRGPLQNLSDTFQQKLLPALGNFIIAAAPIATFIITVLGPALGTLLTIVINVANFIATLDAKILNFVTAILTSGPQLKSWLDGAVTWFQELPGRVVAALAALPGVVATAVRNAAQQALYWAGYLVGYSIRTIATLPGKAMTAVSALWRMMSGAFSTARTNVQNAGTNIVNGFVNFLKNLPSRAAAAIRSAPGQIKHVFDGAEHLLESVGANILKGLVAGMKGAVGAAVNAAIGAAKSVINGLKSGLGIHSPSKVAEEEVGKFVMPGVARGIKKSMPQFNTTVQGLAPAVATPAAATAVQSASTTSTSSTRIGTVNLNVKGSLSPDDPVAMRKLIAQLYAELAKYEKSYA